MKKILIVLISILMILVCSPISADEEDVVEMSVQIEETDEGYIAIIPELDLISETKPTMKVNTNFSKNDNVGVLDVNNVRQDGVAVSDDGVVSFVVKKGGTYIIKLVDDVAPTPAKPSYVIPKTGIE